MPQPNSFTSETISSQNENSIKRGRGCIERGDEEEVGFVKGTAMADSLMLLGRSWQTERNVRERTCQWK